MEYTLNWLMSHDGFACPSCGRQHFGMLKECITGMNAADDMIPTLEKYGVHHPFVLCDRNTYAKAGEKGCASLREKNIPYTLHVIERDHPAPDEKLVGEAVMYWDTSCDGILVFGSGVLNDTGKILANLTGVPYILVATAPSMDGFASATSSMERAGLKISLSSRCPDAVIGDARILADAPPHMIASGIGDMLAKYVSIVEWKIAALLIGEDYCDTAAQIVRAALADCVKNGAAAVRGDEQAVLAVMNGLVISGLAMNYAGISRPASGMEHYISHILDMRALAFGTPSDLHGIQCGIASLITIRAYEELRKTVPNREKALQCVQTFDGEAWNAYLREKLGHGAEAMIAGEAKEGKYDLAKHAVRLEKIADHWEEILAMIGELPSSAELEAFMKEIGHPTSFEEIGLTKEDVHDAFLMAKDIRDKYVLGRLLWDLGMLI
ncbi:MAG: sn-glycerol-1-phosphate dehydrogenase [Clostridia bacterium]|nr:sn-glycerol-1-phosphate dehydrogenase [Clostridia bacterium]